MDKTLYLLMYHTGQEDPRGTVGHLELFYATDEEDARRVADEFKIKRSEELDEVVYEEYLEPQRYGFTIHGAILSGTVGPGDYALENSVDYMG